jgi:hypothetical protein
MLFDLLYRPTTKLQLVSMDALPQGTVLEAVPEAERCNPQYVWRGIHLGALALNVMRGKHVLNVGRRNNLLHAVSNYSNASAYAQTMVAGGAQFTGWHARKYERYTRSDLPEHFPTMVAGIDKAAMEGAVERPVWGEATEYILEKVVSLDHLDPHSLAMLTELWETDLMQTP